MINRGVARAARGPVMLALSLCAVAPPRPAGGQIPAAAAQPRDSLTMWVGDTLRLTTIGVLEREPSGAARPSWSSSDSSVAMVADAALVGVGPGRARVTVLVEDRPVALRVVVFPVATGQLFAPGGDGTTGLRAVVRHGTTADSADVSSAGAFAVRLTAAVRGAVEVAVDAAAGERRFHPVLLRVDAHDLARPMRVVLVPASWTVTSGRYAGRTVPVSAAAAMRRTRDRSRYWRTEEARGSSRVVGWPQELFPVPVTFKRDEGGAIDARDSTAFWAVLDTLEADMGMDLFAPARYEDVRGEKDAIVVDVDRTISTAGLTLAAWNEQGRIFGASVSFQSSRLLGDAHVVTHEMLHALGFGHTASWPSVMGLGSDRPTRPTPEDVAYAQLLYRVLDAQRVHDARYGLLEAEAGERRLGGRWLRAPDDGAQRAGGVRP